MPLSERGNLAKVWRAWFGQLFTVPSIIATAIITAAASWVATQFFSDMQTRIEVRNPVAITLQDNPALIGAFSDSPIYAVLPTNIRIQGNPGSGCSDFQNWARRNDGADAGTSKLRVVVQSKIEKPVFLAGMRVKVVERLPPLQGIPVACPPAGEISYRAITIDLDKTPPRIMYKSGSRDFGFTLQKGDIEGFNIVAMTKEGRFKWLLELDVVIEGDQRTIPIGNEATPFYTTPKLSTEWWEWDYQGAWFNGSRRVPADAPLPPL